MTIITPHELYSMCISVMQPPSSHLNAQSLRLKEESKRRLKELVKNKFTLIKESTQSQLTEERSPLKKRRKMEPIQTLFILNEENKQKILDYHRTMDSMPLSSSSLLMCRTYNGNDPEDQAYYNFSIDVESITSEKTTGKELITKKKYFPFFRSEDGLCHGEVLYFIYLFFEEIKEYRSQKPGQFLNAEDYDHIILKVSQPFKNGGPLQAAMLQLIDLREELDLLELMYENRRFPSCQFLPDLLFCVDRVEKIVSDLPMGVYYVYLKAPIPSNNHAIILLKISNYSGYIIDLNYGPMKCASDLLGKHFVNYLKENFKEKEVVITLYFFRMFSTT